MRGASGALLLPPNSKLRTVQDSRAPSELFALVLGRLLITTIVTIIIINIYLSPWGINFLPSLCLVLTNNRYKKYIYAPEIITHQTYIRDSKFYNIIIICTSSISSNPPQLLILVGDKLYSQVRGGVIRGLHLKFWSRNIILSHQHDTCICGRNIYYLVRVIQHEKCAINNLLLQLPS